MCSEHAHVCSHKEHYYTAEGVGVAQRQRASKPVYHHAESQTCDSSSFLPKTSMFLQAELQTSQTTNSLFKNFYPFINS